MTFAKSSPREVFWLLSGLSVIITLIILGISLGGVATLPPELPLAIATSLFSFAAIPLFVMALRDFKHTLRHAYVLLCVGIVLYGIGQLQFPLFEIIDGSAWVESGGVILPYIISIVCLFLGVRRFGKVVGLKSLWIAPWLAFPAGIILAIIAGFLIASDQATAMQFEIFLGTILLFSVMTVVHIKAMTAHRYQQALTLLALSLGMLMFAAIHHIIVSLMLPADSWYFNSGIILWPPFLAAVFFSWAGLAFASIRLEETRPLASTSPVEVITYIASFASNPSAINKPLDTLRSITATVNPNDDTLSKQQEVSLAELYKELEEYLITKEPLQHFTQAALREMVRTRFQFNKQKAPIFWALFTE